MSCCRRDLKLLEETAEPIWVLSLGGPLGPGPVGCASGWTVLAQNLLPWNFFKTGWNWMKVGFVVSEPFLLVETLPAQIWASLGQGSCWFLDEPLIWYHVLIGRGRVSVGEWRGAVQVDTGVEAAGSPPVFFHHPQGENVEMPWVQRSVCVCMSWRQTTSVRKIQKSACEQERESRWSKRVRVVSDPHPYTYKHSLVCYSGVQKSEITGGKCLSFASFFNSYIIRKTKCVFFWKINMNFRKFSTMQEHD